MQNKRIYSIGETVFDIILKGDAAMGAKAGGAMLNTAVSLGRLGLHVELLSEIGLDDVGEQVIRFLENNEVGTRYIYRFDHGKTALAIAFWMMKMKPDTPFTSITRQSGIKFKCQSLNRVIS